MISQTRDWKPKGRPPSSRRIRAKDLALVDVRSLGHATREQFIPYFETLRQFGRIPSDAPLSNRRVEVTLDLPSGKSSWS